MPRKVRKAVIPAAGLGTRFLPATKAQPKEMLPIVDKPTIQYIIEEAVASGIHEILIITGRNKRAIEDHFDRSIELEMVLEGKNSGHDLEMVRAISEMADILYVRQKEPRGLGHAVWCARNFVGDEPFAVLLGDDVIANPGAPVLRQMLDAYEATEGATILGVQPVAEANVHKYGILKPQKTAGEVVGGADVVAASSASSGPHGRFDGRLFRVDGLVEKPRAEQAPSNLAVLGRYIINPEIFNILENTPPGAGGEIQLTDALRELAKTKPVYGFIFEGRRYDVGDKLGFLQATVEFALARPDLREEFLAYLKSIVGQE